MVSLKNTRQDRTRPDNIYIGCLDMYDQCCSTVRVHDAYIGGTVLMRWCDILIDAEGLVSYLPRSKERPAGILFQPFAEPDELVRSSTRWGAVPNPHPIPYIPEPRAGASTGHTPDTQAAHRSTDIRPRTSFTRPSSLVVPAQCILAHPGLSHGWYMREGHTLG